MTLTPGDLAPSFTLSDQHGDDVRLVSNVIDAAPGEMAVGLRVTLAWDEIENGMFLPRFRKAAP